MALWLHKLLAPKHDLHPEAQHEDATCTVMVVPKKKTKANLPAFLRKTMHPRSADSAHKLAARQFDMPATTLLDLPGAALDAVWGQLDADSKRAVRIATPLFWASVRSLQASLPQLAARRQPWHTSFPSLNALYLQLEDATDEQLAAFADTSLGCLHHLHTLAVDSALHGESFRTLAQLLVATPSLTVLRLREHSFRSARDQRALACVLDALPGLVELDLGSARSDAGAPLSSAVTTRISHLTRLRRLACNACQLGDDEAAAMLQPLVRLQLLSIAVGDGDDSGMMATSHALAGLSRLTQLEFISDGLRDEDAALALATLTGLRELTLGSCPQLTSDIMPEIARLSQLEVLSLPFSLEGPCLRRLARLPALRELLSARRVCLDALGHDKPLAATTKLVAASFTSHGQPLAAGFPTLRCLHLLRCGDAGLAALEACTSLHTLSIADAHHVSDLAALRPVVAAGLASLTIEHAPRLGDAGFQLVFDRPLPQLQQLTLVHFGSITDDALLHVTAACRCLASATFSHCRRLTDKSLCRLAHLDKLSTLQLVACEKVTAEGVVAVAAAPAMQHLSVTACPCVLQSACRQHRAAVQVRVDDQLV